MSKKIIIKLLFLASLFIALSGISHAEQTTHKAVFFSENTITKSDNPVMFLTDNALSVKPLSAPPISKFIVETDETVVYDIVAQEETVISNK